MDKSEQPPSRTEAVRSFVKRQGRLTAGQRRALVDLWPNYGLDFTGAPLDFAAAFNRDAPIVVEVGFGNGDNLINMAQNSPEQNFIGIEVHEPGVGHCLLEIEISCVTNVRVIRHDAIEVLQQMIPDHSLSRVNLFFPDPWPKKRHHKRRIVRRTFVALLAKKLLPGGIFHAITDWENYAVHIAELMTNSDEFNELESLPEDRSVSRFDNRGQQLGHINWERAWCTRNIFP